MGIINSLKMKKEKLILYLVAVFFGLMVAGVAFYFFQNPKASTDAKDKGKTISLTSPSPTTSPSVFLEVTKPKDEEVVDSKTQVVSGKTKNNAVVVIITDSDQTIITPSANGEFSTEIEIGNGENILEITAISPNGESITDKKTITYSDEEF